jgi:hypothetical protein
MMKLFKSKTPWTKPFSERVAKRVKKIPTGELSFWVDQAMYDLSRCLGQYEKTREPAYLTEALVGAEAIHAVVDELNSRMTKANLRP